VQLHTLQRVHTGLIEDVGGLEAAHASYKTVEHMVVALQGVRIGLVEDVGDLEAARGSHEVVEEVVVAEACPPLVPRVPYEARRTRQVHGRLR